MLGYIFSKEKDGFKFEIEIFKKIYKQTYTCSFCNRIVTPKVTIKNDGTISITKIYDKINNKIICPKCIEKINGERITFSKEIFSV